MSETPQNGHDGSDQAQAGAASLRVFAQYLKDLSFENPRAPASFRDNGPAPVFEVNVDVNARGLGQDQYEVELSVSARARRSQDIIFQLEATYAGAFEILNLPAEHIERALLAECPQLLFPFVRQIVAEVTAAGNYPAFLLEPIDFRGMYQRNQMKKSEPGVGASADA